VLARIVEASGDAKGSAAAVDPALAGAPPPPPRQRSTLPDPSALLPPSLATHIAQGYNFGETVTTRAQQDTIKSLVTMCASAGQPPPTIEYRTSIGLRLDIALASPPPGQKVSRSLGRHDSASFDAKAVVAAASAAHRTGSAAGVAIKLNGPHHYAFGVSGLIEVESENAEGRAEWAALEKQPLPLQVGRCGRRRVLTASPPPHPLPSSVRWMCRLNLSTHFRHWLLSSFGLESRQRALSRLCASERPQPQRASHVLEPAPA